MHLHEHDVLVLARDGVQDTGSPRRTDSLEVKNGEMYDVVFRANNPGLVGSLPQLAARHTRPYRRPHVSRRYDAVPARQAHRQPPGVKRIKPVVITQQVVTQDTRSEPMFRL